MKYWILLIFAAVIIASCVERNSPREEQKSSYSDNLSVEKKVMVNPTDSIWSILVSLHHSSVLDAESSEIVTQYLYAAEHEQLNGKTVELAGYLQRFGNGIHLTRYDCAFKFCGVGEDDSKKSCLPEEMVFLKGFTMPTDSTGLFTFTGLFKLNKEHNRQFCYILEKVEVVD